MLTSKTMIKKSCKLSTGHNFGYINYLTITMPRS